jgi:acetoin utilization deacetylase AcuC-like enzyme
VRPPGHHAEMNKPGGFCFLNNAGIAAKHAQQKYGVKKVAVLDFDVHHGNGKRSSSKLGGVNVYMYPIPVVCAARKPFSD